MISWSGHVVDMGEIRKICYILLVDKPEGGRTFCKMYA